MKNIFYLSSPPLYLLYDGNLPSTKNIDSNIQ